MRIKIYLVRGKIIIPRSVQTQAGWFTFRPPTLVYTLEAFSEFEAYLLRTEPIANEVIPNPTSRQEITDAGIFAAAKVRSWAALEKVAREWTIVYSDGTYELTPAVRVAPRGTIADIERKKIFSGSNAIHLLCAELLSQMKENEG